MNQRGSMMFRKFFKTFSNRAVEAAGAILLALLCFVGFLLILKLLFPSGTSLSEMTKGAEPRQTTSARRYTQGEQIEPFAAKLVRYNSTVKAKVSGEVAWSDVREGMSLYNSDAVQTAQ